LFDAYFKGLMVNLWLGLMADLSVNLMV